VLPVNQEPTAAPGAKRNSTAPLSVSAASRTTVSRAQAFRSTLGRVRSLMGHIRLAAYLSGVQGGNAAKSPRNLCDRHCLCAFGSASRRRRRNPLDKRPLCAVGVVSDWSMDRHQIGSPETTLKPDSSLRRSSRRLSCGVAGALLVVSLTGTTPLYHHNARETYWVWTAMILWSSKALGFAISANRQRGASPQDKLSRAKSGL
jgi:hypothetical protein